MRVLAIRGSNLASLAGHFDVDFATGPLADAGIFAITGPTGAGKSTLLDAMSLALFDEIPRLASLTGREGNLTDSEISLKDSRGILRHGAGDGHAELDFVARDGKSYRSRWSVRRARGHADGKVQKASIDLECLDTGERLGGTKRETLSEIERLIGLNAQQFGRAVVLAQGEFEAFIKASGDERALLLEKLTGAAIYTVLGRKAFEKAREVRSGYDSLKEQIARQEGLTDDERLALQATLAEIRSDRDTKARAHEKLLMASRWAERLAELTEKAAQSRQARQEAQLALEQAAPRESALKRRKSAFEHAGQWRQLAAKRNEAKQARQTLTDRERAEQEAQHAEIAAQAAEQEASAAHHSTKERNAKTEPELVKAREADRALSDAEKRSVEATAALAACRLAHQQAQAKAAEAQAAHDAVISKRADLERWRKNNAGLEKLAREETGLAEDLAGFAACSGRRSALEVEHHGAKAQVDKAQQALDEAGRALTGAESQYTAAETALDAARKEAPDADALQRLETQRDVLLDVQNRQSALQQAREREAEAHSALADGGELVAKTMDELTANEGALSQIKATLPALEARMNEAERNRIRVLAASEDGIVALREALEEGEPCPVCGATEHRLGLVEGILGEAAEEASARAAETGAAVEQARRQSTVLVTEIEGSKKVLARARTDQERQSQTLATRVSEREVREADRNVARETASLSAHLEEEVLVAHLAERLSEIEVERKRMRGAAAGLEACRQDEEEKRGARDAAREARELGLAALRQANEALAQIVRQMEGIAVEQDGLAVGIDRIMMDHVDWRGLSDPADWLAARAGEWRSKEEEWKKLDARIPALFEQWTGDKAVALGTSRDLDKAHEADSKAQAERDGALKARQGMLGGRPVREVEAELSQSLTAAQSAYEAGREALVTAQNAVTGARSRREEVTRSLASLEDDLTRLEEAFEKALAAADLSVEDVVQAAQDGSEALQREEAELRQLHTAVAESEAALRQRERDLAVHEKTARPEVGPETLADQLEQSKAALDLADTTLKEHEYRLRKDDDVRERTAKLRTELAEAQDRGRVWEELADLIGDANGKTFRNFAQSLTLDRLLDCANERLADLKPRYTLQRALGGEMLIEVIDNDMGGQLRGLQNLSGGERFLVSLALALGLAEMSTGRGVNIESLFIDEGFGALDSASLGQAVAVLEHLHAQGRRVGVISHVEELKERISAKIEVSPVSGGRSEISVSFD